MDELDLLFKRNNELLEQIKRNLTELMAQVTAICREFKEAQK